MSKPNWKVTTSEMMEKGVIPSVVLAGACSVVKECGPVRNQGRDKLGEWLSEKGISFYEVQVDPSTHGRRYDHNIDGPKEKLARQIAKLRVYEIRPDTFCGVTMLEAMDDHANQRNSIVWFHGTGFAPIGLGNRTDINLSRELEQDVGALIQDHLYAYANAGHQMRVELQKMLQSSPYVTFVYGDEKEVQGVIIEKMWVQMSQNR